jgi:hypothetical protein
MYCSLARSLVGRRGHCPLPGRLLATLASPLHCTATPLTHTPTHTPTRAHAHPPLLLSRLDLYAWDGEKGLLADIASGAQVYFNLQLGGCSREPCQSVYKHPGA